MRLVPVVERHTGRLMARGVSICTFRSIQIREFSSIGLRRLLRSRPVARGNLGMAVCVVDSFVMIVLEPLSFLTEYCCFLLGNLTIGEIRGSRDLYGRDRWCAL
jgi:hypothetical protein